jgi:malonyl-CoA/methylmalonyl-CoA synthetase
VIFLPLNTAYTGAEIAYFIENSGAKLVLCDAARHADLTPIAAGLGARLETLNGDGTGSFAAMADGHLTAEEFVALANDPTVTEDMIPEQIRPAFRKFRA